MKDWKSGITSASPGLVLAFFGTALMLVALIVQTTIEVQDRPVYLVSAIASGPPRSSTAAEKPGPIDPFADGSTAPADHDVKDAQ